MRRLITLQRSTFGSAAAGSLNTELMRSERLLTEDRGLPNRPWFEHLLYAPGFYTGYGVKTIPGVREAMSKRNGVRRMSRYTRVSAALERETDWSNRLLSFFQPKRRDRIWDSERYKGWASPPLVQPMQGVGFAGDLWIRLGKCGLEWTAAVDPKGCGV